MLPTSKRVRKILQGCRSEFDACSALVRHGIGYSIVPYSSGYAINLRVPVRTGAIRIYQTAGRGALLMVQFIAPAGMVSAGMPVYNPAAKHSFVDEY